MEHKINGIGMVGLGRMGGNLSLQAMEKGIRVVGYTKGLVPDELINAGLVSIPALAQFREKLSPPRAIFLYIPAGPAVDEAVDKLASTLDSGDILIDGGNSYWGDSIRRYRRIKERGLHFIDLGTSGGVDGARHGACFMAGGDDGPVSAIEPVLLKLCVQGGYAHAGSPGMGHFTKLVHNGIEFGMLQAIGEGVSLLEQNKEMIKIQDVLSCWRHGSVIRGWLIDLMEEAYRHGGGLDGIPSYVEDTGEVNWLVSDALRMEVPIPVISQSVMELFASRDGKKVWARAIAAMRHGFGGHPFGPSEPVRAERRGGRVGDIFREAEPPEKTKKAA